MLTKTSLLLGSALLAVVATPALAQNQATAPAQLPVDELAAEADMDAGEIIVTATKRETNLQQTPISIAVMGNEQLKQRHVQSLIDLADGAVPSLRVATFEARQSALTIGIRGIVPLDANQPAREQGVGVYIDGVYLGRQHGLNASLFDVERVEILKGPQGTLFGRNAEGGALSMVTKAPTGVFGGKMTAGIGNYGAYNAALHMDLPAVANLAFKVDGVIQHQGPTVKNPMAGEAGWNQYHRYGGRLSARWQPVDGLTIDLAYDRSRDENTPFYSQLLNFNPNNYPVATAAQIIANGGKVPAGMVAPLPSLVQYGDERMDTADIGVPQQPSVDVTEGYTATIKYAASPAIELRSITAWRSVSDAQWDNSGGAHRPPVFTVSSSGGVLSGSSFSRYSLASLEQHQFSQEFQAVGTIGNVDYAAGLYYFNERAGDWARTPNTNKWIVDANGNVMGYSINDPAQYLNASIARASNAQSKSYAAFANAVWNLRGNLHLTVGGRYTHDEKNGLLYIVSGAPKNLVLDKTWNHFDPTVTVAWEPNRDINLYAKYSTGYRAGGASSRSPSYRGFDPEVVKSYEIGAKTDLFNRLLRFNVAAYMMDRTDSQVDFNFFVRQSNGQFLNQLETVNAIGTTKIRGIEADLTLRPTDNLQMGLSYAYTYTKVPLAQNTILEELQRQAGTYTGPVYEHVYIVFTPKNALAGTLDYSLPLGNSGTSIKLHADANYSDPVYSFDNESVKTDKSFIVNARLSLADIPMSRNGQTLTLSAWARNLFNEQHIYRRSNANSTTLPTTGTTAIMGDYANFNAPRTFGLEGTLTF